MIGEVSLGTNDRTRAAACYDAWCAAFGARRLWAFEPSVAWGIGEDERTLRAMPSSESQAARLGNGVPAGHRVAPRAQVRGTQAGTLPLGRRDEGTEGARGEDLYAGCFRRLDRSEPVEYCLG